MSKKKNRQSTRSQKMLRTALLELLQEKPLHKIGISEITERADLARSTFYTHFESKEELLNCCIDQTLSAFFDYLKESGSFDEVKDVDNRFWTVFFRQWKEDVELIELFKVPELGKVLIERLKTNHQAVYNEKISQMVPDLNPVLAGYFIEFLAFSSFAVLKHWVETDMGEPPEALGELMNELTSSTKSLEVIDKLKNIIR